MCQCHCFDIQGTVAIQTGIVCSQTQYKILFVSQLEATLSFYQSLNMYKQIRLQTKTLQLC